MFNTSLSNAMVEKAIGANWQRMQVIAHNVANEDTPGYKAKRLAFEGMLKKEIGARTNVTALNQMDTVERIQNLQPTVYTDRTTSGRADGNNVDVDAENMELARAQLQWDMLIQKVSGHYSTLRYVVTGR